MADSTELLKMVQDLATKSSLDRSPEMRDIPTLALGVIHCLRKLDVIDKAQRQILEG